MFGIKVDANIDIHIHDSTPELLQGLRVLTEKVTALQTAAAASAVREIQLAKEMDDIEREVSENGAVIESATILLGNLSTLIRENAGNPAKLRELASTLDSQQQSLAAAIAANTPAAEPAPAPAPEG